MNLKVGEYIRCKKDGYMRSGRIFAHAGKQYLIKSVSEYTIILETESCGRHNFSLDYKLFWETFDYGGFYFPKNIKFKL